MSNSVSGNDRDGMDSRSCSLWPAQTPCVNPVFSNGSRIPRYPGFPSRRHHGHRTCIVAIRGLPRPCHSGLLESSISGKLSRYQELWFADSGHAESARAIGAPIRYRSFVLPSPCLHPALTHWRLRASRTSVNLAFVEATWALESPNGVLEAGPNR